MSVNKFNVGKIAERIVMNELEANGHRASDLNKDGLSANADVLASLGGKIWQIQVKGAVNVFGKRWWIQYGYSTPELISEESKVFNRKDSFYTAQYVALVAVRSPSEYRCFVLPITQAEKAAQLNLDRYYRQPRVRDGGERAPGKMWVNVDQSGRDRLVDARLDHERKILLANEGIWALQ